MQAPSGRTCFLPILVLCAVAAFGFGSASGQPRPRDGSGDQPPSRASSRPGPALPDSTRIAEMVNEMNVALSLSDEQKDRIAELHFAHFDEVRERMANGRPPREEMEALRKEFEKAVKAELRDDQRAAYDEFVARRRPPRDGGGRRR